MAVPRSLVGRVLEETSRFGFTGLPWRAPRIIRQLLNCINQMIYKYAPADHGRGWERKREHRWAGVMGSQNVDP